MAEWFMEGFLKRLLDGADPVARELLKRATFEIVPNIIPPNRRTPGLAGLGTPLVR